MDEFEKGGQIRKILMYAHDTFGLGHANRIICIANYLANDSRNKILIITGSSGLVLFKIHKTVDVIKIPSLYGDLNAQNRMGYTSLLGSKCNHEIFELRREMITKAVTIFRPDIFFVDHNPLGANKELLEILQYLKARRKNVRLYLGQRDIYYEKSRYKKIFSKNNWGYVLHNLYDKIFIYGQKNIFDYLKYYGLPPKICQKAHYLGYIVNSMEVQRKILSKNKIVTVLGGGGKDGRKLIDLCLKIYPVIQREGLDMLINLGPLMSEEDSQLIKKRASKYKDIILKDYIYNTKQYIYSSDLVISMGGYNTLCEILATNTPALIFPRCTNDREQLLRAQIMHRNGLVDFINPKKYTEENFLGKIFHLLKMDRGELANRRKKIEFNGLENLAKHINA